MKKLLALTTLLLAVGASSPAQSVTARTVFDLNTGKSALLTEWRLDLPDGRSLGSSFLDGKPVAIVRAPAQLAQNDTAAIGEVYSFAWSSSGNAYSLADLPLYQTYFALPFGLDFAAGHSVVYGQAMNGTEFVGNVFGYSLFVQKDVGGDGAFLRFAASVLLGKEAPDYALSAGLGFRF